MRKRMIKDLIKFVIAIGIIIAIYFMFSSCQNEGDEPQPVEPVGDAVLYIEEHM